MSSWESFVRLVYSYLIKGTSTYIIHTMYDIIFNTIIYWARLFRLFLSSRRSTTRVYRSSLFCWVTIFAPPFGGRTCTKSHPVFDVPSRRDMKNARSKFSSSCLVRQFLIPSTGIEQHSIIMFTSCLKLSISWRCLLVSISSRHNGHLSSLSKQSLQTSCLQSSFTLVVAVYRS
eukprot:Lithocolla_globosa_v1_NODE_113_length_6217_cov_73.628043.p4 type:complete len:174 gc:universal NODE_113_length_6217_cov_73.628043:3619-4140(+)